MDDLKIKIGKRLKSFRKKKKLTQASLADGIVTRNMLSLIESGKSLPSLECLCKLAASLDIDVAYLISDKDYFVFEKAENIDELRSLMSRGSYSSCLDKALGLSDCDDELTMIIVRCAYHLGKECVYRGALRNACRYFDLVKEYSAKTVYPNQDLLAFCELYLSVAKNIQSPLLEFKTDTFKDKYLNSDDMEFFRYVTMDYDCSYKNPLLSRHVNAKLLIKAHKYKEALEVLLDIADNKKKYGYNAYVIFSVYTDIEYVMRELSDFEGAYRYSTKRISMLNSFNS